jgi:perosamine synthetase
MINQIEPWIDDEEKEQLLRVIESTFVTESSLTKEFEQKIKDLTGSKHAISMTNGTVALYCCLLSLGIGPGDEVIVPDLTFVATSNAVVWTGAKPVFCDVDESCCIDTSKIEELLTPRTKAILPVHLYGDAVNMQDVIRIAKKHNLAVVEDGAQGVGVLYQNRHVASFGDCGILSFYGNKTVTCGEGGVVVTDNDEIAKKCYRLKNHGRDVKGSFVHETIGFNFSFTEMQAAIGIAQLNKLQRICDKKKSIYDLYRKELSGIDFLRVQQYRVDCKPVHWFTSIFVEEDKQGLKKFLNDRGIQTRDFFYPLHLQPCYSDLAYDRSKLQMSERLFNTGLSLPSSYHLTDEQQHFVIQNVRDFYDKR